MFSSDNSIIPYTSSSIFCKWSAVIEGAYDTHYEDFIGYKLADSLTNDMILTMASAGIVAVAMLVHIWLPWMTGIGLFQTILSFPLSYLVFNLIAGLEFYPFLNFIDFFVVFAL